MTQYYKNQIPRGMNMKHLKYFTLYLLLSLVIFSFFPKNAYSYTINKRPHILILNSYHYGHDWTDSIVNEVLNVYKAKLPNTDISIEYMDTKRVSSREYYDELYRIYRYKYSSIPIDLIISSDNSAFDFLLKYRDEIFPNIPVVFCGVNNFNNDRLSGHELFTGIVENADINSNIEIALKLHPNTKNIVVITNKDSSNASLKNDLALAVLSMDKKISLDYIEDNNIDEVQKKVLELPKDSIIFLLTPKLVDSYGQFISETEASKIIDNTTRIPMYSLWGYYAGNGIVGGMLTSGANQGKQAAEVSIKILKGTKLSQLPVINNSNSNKLIFDYRQLKYLGISNNLLPAGSTIINAPPRSYTINKKILWIAVFCIILILMITVIILSITIPLNNLIFMTRH